MIEYIIYYIVFALIGWLFENIFIRKKNPLCGDEFMNEIGVCLPLLTMYGLGGITLLFIKKNMIKDNIILFSIISGTILTVIECIGGQISELYTKNKRWNYSNYPLAMCNGYIALPVFILWSVSSAVFFKIHDKIHNK
jgi:uncharacterized membrane protein